MIYVKMKSNSAPAQLLKTYIKSTEQQSRSDLVRVDLVSDQSCFSIKWTYTLSRGLSLWLGKLVLVYTIHQKLGWWIVDNSR